MLARCRTLAAASFVGAVLLISDPTLAQARKGKKSSHVERDVSETTRDGLPNIQANAAVVVDYDGGQELYAKNADEVRPIASVGKIFLALAIRDKGIPLDGKTVITDDDKKFASGGARSRLPVGKTFANMDLLRAMLISSDNRACTALGRGAGLSPDELIAAMNEKAKQLGLVHTKFVDPTGLKGNVSTPREVAIALRAALADPVIAEIMTTPHIEIKSLDAKKPVTVEYTSTDVALRSENKKFEILGGKTGYTDDARYCLAIAAKLDGKRVGMVFLGAEGKLTRFGDFHRAAEWVVASAGKPTAQVSHPPGATSNVGSSLESPPGAVTPRLTR